MAVTRIKILKKLTEYISDNVQFFNLHSASKTIRFKFCLDCAPVTSMAFAALLPFTRAFLHARVSGQEIWINDAPPLDIIQENASVFTEPGDVVFGPLKPTRTKTSGCLRIYYGEGRGLDCCNIFAKVFEDDLGLLKALGDNIWKYGVQEITFDHPGYTGAGSD
ncbi:MAG: DUF3830 family protein [Ferruginibacter sp.]